MQDSKQDNDDANIQKLQKLLGNRIRSLRNERGLKIIELAEKSGLTSSTISQIERALLSPSIASLKKICDAMGVPVGCLFENYKGIDINNVTADTDVGVYSNNNIVVRKDKRKIMLPTEGVRYYLLNPNLAGQMEMIYNEIEPGKGTGPDFYSHPGSECGVVLSGEITVQINDKDYVLQEGDSITFSSAEPHLLRNDSDKLSVSIWVNVPPWF
jgi:transcriptional regulator with XRE-family HTH domain